MDTNEILTFIKTRRSIRKFKNNPIPDEVVKISIEAARFAPSNTNFQPWKFIQIKDKTIKIELHNIILNKIKAIAATIEQIELKEQFLVYANYFTFFDKAPGLMAVVFKKSPSLLRKLPLNETFTQHTNAELCSVSAAIQNFLLMLHAQGYGACWMTGPLIAKKELEAALNVNIPWELTALIPFGLPESTTEEIPPRKDLPKIFGVKE